LLDLTNINNIERSIERFKKKNCFGQIPKNLNELGAMFTNKHWEKLIQIDETHSFIMKNVIKNNDIKAVIFIDKYVADYLYQVNTNMTIFVDGTFATVPQLKNNNCQLWTIVIKYNDRVSKTI
jgi:hypothetical protein